MAAPALLAAIPLLVGVLCGAAWLRDAAPIAVALAAVWLVAAIALWRGRAAAALAAMLGGFFAAGALIGGHAQFNAEHSSLAAWYGLAYRSAEREGGPVRITGVLREDASRTAAAVSVLVDIREIDGVGVRGGARISVAGTLGAAAASEWREGRTLALTATLRVPLDYRDPGVASDRARLLRQGIALLGTAKSGALVDVRARGGFFSELAGRLRSRVRRAAASAVGRWSPTSAGVVTAILIGDRSGLDPDDERRLQEAGTYHVIAISGGNIALLTALLIVSGRALRLPARGTAAASIGLLAFYGYAAGLAPSVLRATIAGMVYLAAHAVDHRGTAVNAVGVAAAFACVFAPLSILDPGFVLSFGATFAIIVAAHRIGPPATKRRERPRGRVRAWVTAALRAARLLLAATICAEIALAPAGAMLFGRVSFAGLVLNFAAIPLMSIIQIAGLIAVALDSLSSSAAAAAGWVAHIGTVALLRSASLVDVAPWLVIDLPPPAPWVVVMWYGGWAGLLVAARRSGRRVAAAAVAIAVISVAADLPGSRANRLAPPPSGWMRVVFLDVGQGDATLLFPPGVSPLAPLMIDAGGVPGSAFDLGRRVTLPAAWAFGVRRLGALVLTHGDPDHIGGAAALVRALAPVEIWEGVPVPRHEPLQKLRAAADRAGIRWVERRAGEHVRFGAVSLRVLNPPPPDWERQKVRNDDSIVLEARIGDVAVLLPGDITREVEPAVAAQFDPAPLAIVKAPHHGSAGSSSQPFVDALHPAAAIFSAGKRNPFGHPAPGVVDRYRAAGARVFSTADDGAIVLDTDGHHAVVWCPATGRRETLASRRR